MKSNIILSHCLLVVTCVWLLSCYINKSIASEPNPYKISTIHQHRGESVMGIAVSSRGQVAANIRRNIKDRWRAYSIIQNKRFMLPIPSTALASRAFGINSRGSIVGEIDFENGKTRAALWSGRRFFLIPSLGGRYQTASAINSRGVIVGSGQDITGVYHAFLYFKGVLRTLPSDGRTAAVASINDSNYECGTISGSGGALAPFVWFECRPFLLHYTGYYSGTPTSISNVGLIVGSVTGLDGLSHPVAWFAKQRNILIRTNEQQNGEALCVSDVGEVGGYVVVEHVRVAALWMLNNGKLQRKPFMTAANGVRLLEISSIAGPFFLCNASSDSPILLQKIDKASALD